MKDYLGREVKVGDIIVMSNLSLLEEHVVVSIPSERTIVVSTKRYRVNNSWARDKTHRWNNIRGRPIASHDGKINKWVRPERIMKIGEFDGDMRQFKTVKQLEREYQSQNT